MTRLQNIPCPLRRISQPPPHIVISSPSFCKVDLGEGSLRTVVSGFVPHVPIERMQGLVGIFMCNLTPGKMRGIESQGMLMCAAGTNDRVEPLFIESSTDLMLDDRVCVQDYPAITRDESAEDLKS
ncbi:unnamed protein product [Taenia asiatica]|uniref:tRNA-binding domain-containing protein n=1 Tax=Taenia asiatica TaxID=60517 RepID=A0A3P6RW28_TAEAS|nr:unnamed protein product [Taenia asiatica]